MSEFSHVSETAIMHGFSFNEMIWSSVFLGNKLLALKYRMEIGLELLECFPVGPILFVGVRC